MVTHLITIRSESGTYQKHDN